MICLITDHLVVFVHPNRKVQNNFEHLHSPPQQQQTTWHSCHIIRQPPPVTTNDDNVGLENDIESRRCN